MTIEMGAINYERINTLAIELTNFTAKVDLNNALLQWQTISEFNNSRFIISHSQNRTNFIEIGTVQGSGKSETVKDYSFIDMKPVIGINYYRLSQQDFNGTIKIIGIKELDFSWKKEDLRAYPMNADEIININFAANIYQNLFIINLGGQVFITIKIFENQTELIQNIANLPPGTYLILLKGEANQSQIKFIKNNNLNKSDCF